MLLITEEPNILHTSHNCHLMNDDTQFAIFPYEGFFDFIKIAEPNTNTFSQDVANSCIGLQYLTEKYLGLSISSKFNF